MSTLILPAVIADLFVRRILKSRRILGRGLDEVSSGIIRTKIKDFMLTQGIEELQDVQTHTQIEVDYFRFIYHYVIERSPVHFGQLQNYVALFGFTRTLSFIGCVLFWVVIFRMIQIGLKGIILYHALGLFIGSGVLYLGFNKFYRKFSLEALMAFVTLYEYPTSERHYSTKKIAIAKSTAAAAREE